jgi:glycosyltransferase involved in cell wall biosynthesis
MNALLIGNFLSATKGTRGVCEDLAVQLNAAGWTVLTASAEPGRLRRLWEMVSTVWRRRHDYSVAQVDVYSNLSFVWAEIVCALLKLIGKPYVLTLHGGSLPIFARRWPGRVRHLLHSAEVVTTPSRFLLDQMSPYHSDLLLQPNALDVSAYEFRLRDRPQPRLVWLRAFHRIYNPSLAPRVLALLAPEFPNLRLTMIGPDKDDGSLTAMKQVAAELGIKERILLSGKVPKEKISDWLDTGDIFLNTTNVDNAPVSILEAMACGLCIVSTNSGGIPYLLQDGQDALLVPPNDPQAMAAAVRRCLSDYNLAKRLSRNARRKAEEFDWSILRSRWDRLLTAVSARQSNRKKSQTVSGR